MDQAAGSQPLRRPGVPARTLDRRRLVAGLTGASAAILGLPGTSGVAETRVAAAGRQDDTAPLRLALDGSPSDLDPHLAADARSSLAVMGIYEGLIALKGDQTDVYVGLVAESWQANDDKSVWTFTVRDGVTFHDGTPCDAEDVRASFERYMTVGYGSGADWTRFVPDVAAITAPDAKTVVFTLGKPQPLFEAAVASTYGVYVVNTAVLREHEEDGDWGRAWAQTNAEGTGTGPFTLAQFEPGELLVLDKYDGWWGGPDAPYFDQVVMRVVPENASRRQLLEAGEIDLTDALTADDFDALKENPEIIVQSAPSARVDYFYLTVNGPLATPEARQAMTLAFPYQEVLYGVYQGYATQPAGFVPDTLQGFGPETYRPTTDLDQARALLEAAGVASGTTLELALEPGIETVKLAAQLFQANLAELGISLTITEIETSSYVGLLYGDTPVEERPNLMWWAWWPSYNDAWSQLNALGGCEMTGTNGGANFGGYCNAQVQELLDQAIAESDPIDYTMLLAKAQEYVARHDPPAIFYAQPLSTVAYRQDITGIVLNPINIDTYYFQSIRRE